MVAAAIVGSPGVPTNRTSVLDGLPLGLTLHLYDVDNNVGTELENFEVSMWHCDAVGVYSAVSQQGTQGQKWLRGTQVSNGNGTAQFDTILPGWYVGRAVHYHLRLRLPGATSYNCHIAALCIGRRPNSIKQITPLAMDGIYNSIDSTIADLLTLNLSGSMAWGVSASLNFGLTVDSSDNDDSADDDEVGRKPCMVLRRVSIFVFHRA